MVINYKINNALEKDLLTHLIKCDLQFTPLLSQRVNLKSYANKLFEKAITFEAWNEEELIGCIAAYFNNDQSKVGFITHVSTLKQFEKKGIASLLLKQLEAYALGAFYKKISLEVNKNNINAISFYKKHNFEIISENGDILEMDFKIKKLK